jgi:cellulose 1,4-beta-cellobiosidase
MQIQWSLRFFMKATVALLLAGNATAALAQQHVSNPFVGATQYVNPDYAKEVQGVIAQTTDATLAAQMNVVATYPTAVWLDRIAAIAGSSATGGRLGLTEHLRPPGPRLCCSRIQRRVKYRRQSASTTIGRLDHI